MAGWYHSIIGVVESTRTEWTVTLAWLLLFQKNLLLTQIALKCGLLSQIKHSTEILITTTKRIENYPHELNSYTCGGCPAWLKALG
jgi:hypothetical protein